MQQLEFIDAMRYLIQLFPEMASRLETTEQMDRWVARFGHLELAVWRTAVETYHDDKHYPPTINVLMEYVPTGQRTGTAKPPAPDDLSRYDMRTYPEFADTPLPTDERVPAREVQQLIGDLMQTFNRNSPEETR